MSCNYVGLLYARNNCLKASHNPTITCRRFGFRHFILSPLWPCLLSPFRHVAVLTVNHTVTTLMVAIARNNGSFNRIRQVAFVCTNLMVYWAHASLPTERYFSIGTSVLEDSYSWPWNTPMSCRHEPRLTFKTCLATAWSACDVSYKLKLMTY